MGYGMYFPAHQVGGQLELWGIRSYGVSGVWVKRSSTVVINASAHTTRALFVLKNTQRSITRGAYVDPILELTLLRLLGSSLKF
jgi:hypothetical protein